jgi:hypothetical protein
MGQIRAAQGASGIDVNSGSNVDVQKGASLVAKMDQDQIRENAMRKQTGFLQAAQGEKMQAGLYDYAGRNAMREGKIGALTSIIGGATSVASKWSQGSQVGIYGNTGRSYDPTSLLDYT